MKGFREVGADALNNAMQMIGKDWMLITIWDETQGRANAMTASWGSLGVLWNKNVCTCFIRPQRHSFGLAEQRDHWSIAFLGDEFRNALVLCGRKSGRDMDKLKEAGLSVTMTDGVPVISEAKVVLICRKLYADDLKKNCFEDPALLSHYEQDDFHRMYICEIEKVYVQDETV